MKHFAFLSLLLCAVLAHGQEKKTVRVAVVGHPRDDWRSQGLARTTLAHLSRLKQVFPANVSAANRVVPENVTAPLPEVTKAGELLQADWVVSLQAWEGKAAAWLVGVQGSTRAVVTVSGAAHDLPGMLATELARRMRIPHSLVERVEMAKPKTATAEVMVLLWQGAAAIEPTRQVTLFRQAVEQDPGSALAVNQLGTALARAERSDEALAAFRRAAELDPSFAAAHTNQGLVLKSLKRWDEAASAFHDAIVIADKTATPHLGIARLHDRVGAPFKALDALERAAEVDPSHQGALLTLAEVHLDRQNTRAATDLATRAAKLNPKSIEAWNLLGFINMAVGSYKGAERSFRKALSIRPKHPESLANLGFVLYARGKTKEAEQTLLRAIDLDPKNATAYFFLGKLYLSQDRPNQAHEKLQVAVELNPRLAAARKGLERAEEERRKPPSPGCGCARRSSDSMGRTAALPALLLLGPHIFRLSRRRKRKKRSLQ